MISLAFITLVAVVAAFVLVIVALSKLSPASDDAVTGLFLFPTTPPRPRGVQEMDLPRFVFHD